MLCPTFDHEIGMDLLEKWDHKFGGIFSAIDER